MSAVKSADGRLESTDLHHDVVVSVALLAIAEAELTFEHASAYALLCMHVVVTGTKGAAVHELCSLPAGYLGKSVGILGLSIALGNTAKVAVSEESHELPAS